ncbi:MAG: Lsr2 family protein [Pseudonocardia sp.]|nr:Lsr2 family protein [Pseudonocardia sp.]
MAQIHEVRLVDDLDGGPAAETVEFGLDGRSYEVDLSKGNASKLREALNAYVAAARRTTSTRRRAARSGNRAEGRRDGRSGRAGSDREQNQAIRDWARRRGMKVSDRGRIPAEVLHGYHEDHAAAG